VDMIRDVFGALAHIQEHAAAYGGDPNNIAVTGDSAGGHLAAVAAVMSDRIGEAPYTGAIGSEFLPSYLPADKTAADVKASLVSAIKAAAPSYGVFTGAAWDPAIAPLANIPAATTRVLPPQHCQTGSKDTTVPSATVKTYVDALVAQGQQASFVSITGASHAYFDWKPEAGTQTTFANVGEPALDLMIGFFNGVFYP